MAVCPGTRIKELRQLNGMSQEELGRRVGVQRAAINKYEKGTVTNIPINTIERISATFDVSPSYILGWSDDYPDYLAMEVKILQGVKRFYGKSAVDLLESFCSLSNEGKMRALQYVDDLTKIYKV
ncbi:MAG: helix-turn-helix transcriptional regulator [Parabacteroides sp.]|nr:helix-turn-helix transcriptional regulator [Parabacteroides sp.]